MAETVEMQAARQPEFKSSEMASAVDFAPGRLVRLARGGLFRHFAGAGIPGIAS
jgi:hypothetical protein